MTAVIAVGVGATLAAVVIAIALACREANRTIDAVLNGPATLDQRDVDLWAAQITAPDSDARIHAEAMR